MKKISKALLSFFCTASVLMSGLTVLADGENVTPSGVPYDEIGDAIENWAAENPDKYASFVTAVFDGDEILYTGAFGYYDRENNIEAETDSVYEWGSITKLTVWVSVMQLYEQGRIDLNADVRTYLPDGFLHNLKYDDPVTMLNLMNHNAGWCENTWTLQTPVTSEIMSLEECLYQSEPPQMYRPGEVSSYSNWGAGLAGYIVERITGQSFADYVHENIFEPLGMEHTSILPDHSDNAWVKEKRESLVSYNFDGTSWNENGHQLVYINLYPAGSVTGTITDLALFAQSFVSDECPLFEKPETRDLLLTPSLYLGDTDIPVCCHGLWTEQRENVLLIGHNGGTNACSSDLKFDRESGLGTVYLTAGANPEVSGLLFGRMYSDLSKYQSAVSTGNNIEGVYIGTRSTRHGIFKFFSLLSIFPVKSMGENKYDVGGLASIEQVSDNLLILTQNDHSYPAYFYKTSDGTKIITLGSQSFAYDPTVVPAIVLFVLFMIMAIVGFFMLIYKLIGLLSRKLDEYRGVLFVALSQIFRIVCLMPPFLFIASYEERYGLTRAQGNIFFGVEAAGLLVFAITLISSSVGLFSKETDGKTRVKYVFSVIESIVSIATILLLEMIVIKGI